MSKVSARVEVEAKTNIKNLPELIKEYGSGKMPEAKEIALRTKLISLFTEKTITPEEQDLMETILKRQRNKGKIASRDNYLLNEIEEGRCDDKCVVKVDNPPQVHHLFKGLVCKFNRNPETDRYEIFIPRTIPTEHQMTRDLLLREQRGHFAAEDMYPKPKTLIHKITITEKEFTRWFDAVDEQILERPAQTKQAESYTF